MSMDRSSVLVDFFWNRPSSACVQEGMDGIAYSFGSGGDVSTWHTAPSLDLGSGAPDAVALDFDGDGLFDDAMWDSDGDLIADTAVLDVGADAVYYTDPSGHGIWDRPLAAPTGEKFPPIDYQGDGRSNDAEVDVDGDGRADAILIGADARPGKFDALVVDGRILVDHDGDGVLDGVEELTPDESSP